MLFFELNVSSDEDSGSKHGALRLEISDGDPENDTGNFSVANLGPVYK